MALPGRDKSFEAFQADDAACRQFASNQIGNTSPAQAANQSLLNSAVLGAVIGALLGAAIGAPSADAGVGAAIGGASGLALGGIAGSDASRSSSAALQRRYDIGYVQCMSAKGENVQPSAIPGYGVYPAYYYPYYPWYPYAPYWSPSPFSSAGFIGVTTFHSHSSHSHGGHGGSGHGGGGHTMHHH
jgi:outer membrane lipoprotein SlyB